MSINQVKEDLGAAVTREDADAIFKSAFLAGYTLQELANIIGVSRQAIQLRVARPVRIELLRTYPPAPRIVRKEDSRKEGTLRRKRILGLPVSAPALQVPVQTVNELARLHNLVTTVRGWTPMDSPARQAIKPYGDLLSATILDYGIPQLQLEKLMGLKGRTLTAWLKNHGYLKISPSQKAYQGVAVTAGVRRGVSKIIPGNSCKRGHIFTDSNIGRYKTGAYCKTCRSDAAKLRYHERKAA